MRFDILTLFPNMFLSYLQESILKRAIEQGHIVIQFWNIRDFAKDKHKTVDDYPFGGGSGMVMKPEPIAAALDEVESRHGRGRRVLLTPRGRLLAQNEVREFASCPHLTLICGRYEGVDERVSGLVEDEISIGDYVLSGGELPAMVLLETVSRWLPGVLGAEEGSANDSFSRSLLEYPQYTRPREFRGARVPEELIEGHHRNIEIWRRRESLLRTARIRPDLLENAPLTGEDVAFLAEQGYVIPSRRKG